MKKYNYILKFAGIKSQLLKIPLYIYFILAFSGITTAKYVGDEENAKDLRSISGNLLVIQTELSSMQESMEKMQFEQNSIRKETILGDKGALVDQLQSDLSQMQVNLEKLESTIGRLLSNMGTIQTEQRRPQSVNYQGLSEIGAQVYDMGKLLQKLGNKMEVMERHIGEFGIKLLETGAQPGEIRGRIVNMAHEVIDIGQQLVNVGEPLGIIGLKIGDIADRTDNVKDILKNLGDKLIDAGETSVNQGQKIADSAKSLFGLEGKILASVNDDTGKVKKNTKPSDEKDMRRNVRKTETAVYEMKVNVRKENIEA